MREERERRSYLEEEPCAEIPSYVETLGLTSLDLFFTLEYSRIEGDDYTFFEFGDEFYPSCEITSSGWREIDLYTSYYTSA